MGDEPIPSPKLAKQETFQFRTNLQVRPTSEVHSHPTVRIIDPSKMQRQLMVQQKAILTEGPTSDPAVFHYLWNAQAEKTGNLPSDYCFPPPTKVMPLALGAEP